MLSVLAEHLKRIGLKKEAAFIWKMATSEDDDWDDWEDYDDEEEEDSESDEDSRSILEKAKDEFGITYNYNVAGYICDDGSMLDFSGGAGDKRGLDHRAVESLVDEFGPFEYRSQAMNKFMEETGCIRIGVYGDTMLIDAETMPTHEQLSTIRYILKDSGIGYANVDPPGRDIVELDFPTPNKIYRILMGEY